jgi:hypothetical protein
MVPRSGVVSPGKIGYWLTQMSTEKSVSTTVYLCPISFMVVSSTHVKMNRKAGRVAKKKKNLRQSAKSADNIY